MEGPWEGRVVLENGNGTDRCPSQGTLLKLDDGSWWFIHHWRGAHRRKDIMGVRNSWSRWCGKTAGR